MDRKNQPAWLRLLNALTVLAILLFVFVYQAKLGDWPAYLLIAITLVGAGVNFVIHFKDVLASRPTPQSPEADEELAANAPSKEQDDQSPQPDKGL